MWDPQKQPRQTWRYRPVLSSETLLISDPAAKPDNPLQLTDADKLRMRLIKPALESQGLGDAHENKGGAMVYRQTAISRGVRCRVSLTMTPAITKSGQQKYT